ncbi:hypothetical protein LDENG_00058860 [Lucifuga dentata]|nr:hypothetical protein LDENG_00058860 [Lucifuga dentata]
MKGTSFQATVVEVYSPSRLFVLAQSPEIMEALQSISMELQKTRSGCATVAAYVPCLGEVCSVQFSCDLKWYRGLVQTLSPIQKTANVLYIDFGNEEDVPVERIKPLAANIPLIAPCAMECRVAGVVPTTDSWSGECCIAVRQVVAGKTVTVRLVDTLGSGRIHAADIQLSMGKQLSTFLTEHGYGVKEEVNLLAPTEQDINAMVSASLENFRRFSNGKDNNAWAKPPEPQTQAVGDSFSALVTHLQSPDEIVVQKLQNAGMIQELQLKLREHCGQMPGTKRFRPAPGTACCAQFLEDNQWYRAKVLAYSSEQRVCVGYLDFGNSEEVELSRLRPINTSLLALPMQAIPCALAGVQPVGESWSEESLLALTRRVSNRILRIDIHGAHEGKALVAIIDEGSDPHANVAELLLSAGYALPIITSTNQQAASSNQQQTSAGEPQVSSVACVPLVWSCTELHEGQMVALLASVLQNPQEFYCHINNPKDLQRLSELQAELKQHCEADAPSFTPKVGEPCCALFPGDGAWYRAIVKELCEDKAAVYFVDCGYNMQVEKSHLRPITPQLLTLPFQAVRCWLTGVEALGSEWSSEALLWFQTLVDGEHLSALVRSVTDEGYGVELESRGQNVAAALISEELAKDPRETEQLPAAIPKEMNEDKSRESVKEKEHSHTQAISEDIQTEKPKAAIQSAAAFPVDWTTVKLPFNETFQPLIAAVTSPSLFYLLGPSQVDSSKLQEVMMELAAYCSTNQPSSSSSSVLSKPAPGAICCAQFSADNNWYRAVVLEVGENEVSIIYADYGNTEKVQLSQILPIPRHLLQLPFLITRCALSGKEHFPAVWPVEVLQMFQDLLLKGVVATVQSFDGSANLLSLTLPTEMGGGHLTTMILDALQAQAKSQPSPGPILKADHTGSSTCMTSAEAAPDSPPLNLITENQKGLESPAACTDPTTVPLLPQTVEKKNNISAESSKEEPVQKMIDQMVVPCVISTKTDDPSTSGCCCLSLKTKIDRLEKLLELQLSLIKQLIGPMALQEN